MMAAKGLYLSLFVALIFQACFLPHTESRNIHLDRYIARTWCIAGPRATSDSLWKDINNICSSAGCSSIQRGACSNASVSLKATVLFNLYYRTHGSQSAACNFGSDSFLTTTDPSEGSCVIP